MEARARVLSLLSLLLALLTLVAPLAAQGGKDDKFSLEAAIEPATAKPGDEVTLVLTAKVAERYHAYGTKEPTNIPVNLKPANLELAGLQLKGEAVIPPGSKKSTPAGDTYPLPNTFEVTQQLVVPAGFANGEVTVRGSLGYQICDEKMCFSPAKARFEAKLQITGGAGGTERGLAPGLVLLPDQKLALRARVEPSPVRAGESVTLVLDVKVADGYHAYGANEETGAPVQIDADRLHTGALESAGDAVTPPGERKERGPGFVEHWLPHEFQVTQPLKVPAGAKPGSTKVTGVLKFTLCTENFCEPADELEFSVDVPIEAGDARTTAAPAPAPAPVPPEATDPAPTDTPKSGAAELRQPRYSLADAGDENALTGSWWALILLSIGGGLFALVMPCTYPMIPITFSFFTKQADRRGGNVLPLAVLYGVGIVLMFVLVGVAVGDPIIRFAGHWATNLVIGVAFVVFALSLFGFFTLQLPAFVTSAAGKASTTGGLAGVFLMGATLVVSSFTCTAPIVGALLAGVAEGGHVRVAAGMGVFGLTMAAPFVFLALLPGRVKALPKSGQWMNTLKIALGFVELAAALKFFSNVELALGWGVLPREVFLMAWAFVFVVLALFLFGLMGYRGVPVEGVSKARNGFGLLSLAFAFYCLFGTMGFALDPVMTAFEPPYRLRPVDEHEIVKDDHDAAVALAERQDKLLLVNFTGFT